MGNDSKLGMLVGLGVVLAIALLANPKVPDAAHPAPTASTAAPRTNPLPEASLASQHRDEVPATVVPLYKAELP